MNQGVEQDTAFDENLRELGKAPCFIAPDVDVFYLEGSASDKVNLERVQITDPTAVSPTFTAPKARSEREETRFRLRMTDASGLKERIQRRSAYIHTFNPDTKGAIRWLGRETLSSCFIRKSTYNNPVPHEFPYRS
jgi:hypothetical protein